MPGPLRPSLAPESIDDLWGRPAPAAKPPIEDLWNAPAPGGVPRGTSAPAAPDEGGGWMDYLTNPRKLGGLVTRLGSGYLAGIPSIEPGAGTALGAAIGSGGESLAELIEGKDQDLGAIATAGALGAVPLGKLLGTAKSGLAAGAGWLEKGAAASKDLIGNALKLGGVNVAADVAYRATHGQLPGIDYDWSELRAPAAIGAGGGAALSLGARALPAAARAIRGLGGEESGAARAVTPSGQGDLFGTPATPSEAAASGLRGGAATPADISRARAMLQDPEAIAALDRLWGDVGAPPPRAPRPPVPEGPVTKTSPTYWSTPSIGRPSLEDIFGQGERGTLEAQPPREAAFSPEDFRPVDQPAPHETPEYWGTPGKSRPSLDDILGTGPRGVLEAQPPRESAFSPEDFAPVDQPAPTRPTLSEFTRTDLPGTSASAVATAPRNDVLESLQKMLAGEEAPTLDIVNPEDITGVQGNYSGESAASTEAINRASGMKARGENFVIYDRTGARRVLPNTADSVDVFPRAGESKGIEDAQGNFQLLDDNGGKIPRTPNVAAQPAGRTGTSEAEQILGATPQGQKILDLFDKLYPRWQQSAQGVEDVAALGHVNPNQSVEEFANRLMTEPPRQLMGGERALQKELNAAGFKFPAQEPPLETNPDVLAQVHQEMRDAGLNPDDPELGAASMELLRTLGGAAAGGLIGTGVEPEHRAVGGTLGAIMGALAMNPRIARSVLPYQYEAMLSGAAAPKNITGVTGSIVGAALEHPEMAGNIARSAVSPETWDTLKKAFLSPTGETRWTEGTRPGSFRGPFTRTMGAIDTAGNDILQRSGFPEGYARKLTATSQPRSATGRKIAELAAINPALIPFARTGVNLVERGLERTPLINTLDAVQAMGAEDRLPLLEGREPIAPPSLMRRSLLGLGALGAGAAYGAASDKGGPLEKMRGSLAEKIMFPAAGLYALPAALGAAGVRGYQSVKKSPPSVGALRELAREFFNQLPLPEAASPERYLQRFVPAIGTLFSPVAPGDFDTSGGTFDPMIARVPLLNELMLPRKKKTPGPAIARRR